MRILTTNTQGDITAGASAALLRTATKNMPYFGNVVGALTELGVGSQQVQDIAARLGTTEETDND